LWISQGTSSSVIAGIVCTTLTIHSSFPPLSSSTGPWKLHSLQVSCRSQWEIRSVQWFAVMIFQMRIRVGVRSKEHVGREMLEIRERVTPALHSRHVKCLVRGSTKLLWLLDPVCSVAARSRKAHSIRINPQPTFHPPSHALLRTSAGPARNPQLGRTVASSKALHVGQQQPGPPALPLRVLGRRDSPLCAAAGEVYVEGRGMCVVA